MKNKNIIITSVSIAAAVICIALTFWGNWKNNGVLTTDAFVGVMASFIGVCVTLIVGVQVVSHIEIQNMRKTIREIDEDRIRLKKMMDSFSVEMYNARLSIGNNLSFMALMAQDNKDVTMEFYCLEYSVISDDWSSKKGSTLLARYKRMFELSETIIPALDKDTLENNYQRLSILIVPDNIEYHDEIMALHYQLLSEIKNRINILSKDSHPTNE